MARHLLVTNDFPPKTGGIQVYLHELWRRLEPGRAVVLTASSHDDAASFDENSGVVTERVAGRLLFWPTRRNRRLIEDAIARHTPELVLLDPVWPLGLLGPFLSRPYGVIVHGAEIAIPARLPLVRWSLKFVLRRAQVIVAAGGYPEAEVRRCAGATTPTVLHIPPGVDTNRFRPHDDDARIASRRRWGIAPDALLVASYSRLVPRKGMDTLIRASALLAPQFPQLCVAIGGSGRDRARLERLAQRLGAPVRFLGRVPDDELSPWLSSSDLFVMDCRSRWRGFEQEGFGMVFAEAASCGVAAVAGRSGGSHEAVVDGVTGVVIDDASSASSLGQVIGGLLRDKERRARYGTAAREHILRHGDWNELASRLGQELAPFDHSAI